MNADMLALPSAVDKDQGVDGVRALKEPFRADCSSPQDDEWISSYARVYTDEKGYFVTVETCPYEGCAMFTLPVAKQVYAALGMAIEYAEKMRRLQSANVGESQPVETTEGSAKA